MMDLLKFKFTANDATAGAFRSVRGQLRGVDGALASVQQRVQRVGRSMRNIGAGMTAGITAPLALLGAQSVRLYDDQLKAEAAVQAAITSTGGAAGLTAGELGAMASQLQNLTTFGDEDILQNVTAPLLTFANVSGPIFDRAQASILDMSTLLQMDLKSASVQVGKALNDPILGISALGRAGVQFSEDQQQMIRSLVETGDVAGAQAIILGELETQFQGQAAAAAATPLGQWQQLSNSIGDVKEQLGGQIAPFLTPLVEKVKEAVSWFSELSPEAKKMIVIGGGIAAALGPVVTVLGLATMGVGSLAGAFGFLGSIMLANPIIAVIAGIAAGAYLIYRNWDGLVAWFADLWVTVRDGALAGWDMIAGVLDEYTPQFLKDAWGGLGDFYTGLWTLIADGLRLGWDIIKGLFTGTYTVEALVTDAWDGLAGWFTDMWPRVAATFSAFWDGMKARLAAWPVQFLETGRAMIDQMLAGIRERLPFLRSLQESIPGLDRGALDAQTNLLNSVPSPTLGGLNMPEIDQFNSLGGTAGEALIDGFKDANEIRSPSRVFARLGGEVMAGLRIGVDGGAGDAVNAMDAAGEAMGQSMQNFPFADKMAGWITEAKGFGDVFNAMLADVGQNLLKFALNSAWRGVAENIAGMQSGPGGGSFFSQVLGAAFGVPAGPGGGGGGAPKATAKGFANGGVFSSPVGFAMGNGRGVMGENGAEAIMPLTRVGGKLGVRANMGGGGGAATVVQTFHITVDGGGDDTPDKLIAALRPVMREEAAKFASRQRRERVA